VFQSPFWKTSDAGVSSRLWSRMWIVNREVKHVFTTTTRYTHTLCLWGEQCNLLILCVLSCPSGECGSGVHRRHQVVLYKSRDLSSEHLLTSKLASLYSIMFHPQRLRMTNKHVLGEVKRFFLAKALLYLEVGLVPSTSDP
jgi:hypothetical protein